jgi:hypothetical protein
MNTPGSTASLLLRAVRVGALALLVCAALLPNLARLAVLWRLPPANVEEMAQRDRRFEQLRTALPERGMVGYVSDARERVEIEMRLMLAQFSLAPLILVSGTEQVPIVGDFANPDSIGRGLDPSLTVLRDFGDGVVLLGRAPR